MIAKQITYEDPFTEEQITRTFYFHITKAELIEYEHSEEGGLTNLIGRITEEQNNTKLLPLFKKLIALSYGVRTDNGSFIKSKEATEVFMASEAYSELFMSFYDADTLINFIQGILPKELSKEIQSKYPDGITDPKQVMEQIKKEREHALKNNNSTT